MSMGTSVQALFTWWFWQRFAKFTVTKFSQWQKHFTITTLNSIAEKVKTLKQRKYSCNYFLMDLVSIFQNISIFLGKMICMSETASLISPSASQFLETSTRNTSVSLKFEASRIIKYFANRIMETVMS